MFVCGCEHVWIQFCFVHTVHVCVCGCVFVHHIRTCSLECDWMLSQVLKGQEALLQKVNDL